MTSDWQRAIFGVLALGLIHLVLGLLPGPTLSPSMNLALFATNLFVVFCASRVVSQRDTRAFGLFILGYFILFLLLLVILDRKPLFVLLVIVYASVFRSPFLLGFFALFVLSFVVLQPYAAETFIPLAFVYVVLWRTKDSPRFIWLCLGFGLLCLTAVLLPLVHLIIEDSAQTLWLTLKRPDVQGALWISVASSTLATAVAAVWGVPLAYALARLEFRGKSVIESAIDVPILVPQSVAGIALMMLLGPGSALGRALDSLVGVELAGRFAGIVIAQVFVASPFLIKTAMNAFESVPERLELASRSLGAKPGYTFRRIALPLASRGIFIGLILAWARAVSEFGSIVLFAASPESAPVLVFNEFVRAGTSESRPIATLLLVMCLWIFVVLHFGRHLVPFSLGKTGGRK